MFASLILWEISKAIVHCFSLPTKVLSLVPIYWLIYLFRVMFFRFFIIFKSIYLIFYFNVYLFILGQREGERESQAGSVLSVQRPTRSLTNLEIMTWAKIKIWSLNQLGHSGTPKFFFNRLVKSTFLLIFGLISLSTWRGILKFSSYDRFVGICS